MLVLAWLAFVPQDGSGMNWEGFVSICVVCGIVNEGLRLRGAFGWV